MASRAEKRLAAKAAKDELRLEKKAIELEKILGGKKPEQAFEPDAAKVIPKVADALTPHEQKAEIVKDYEDREGEWSWHQQRDWHPEPGNDYVYGLLQQYQGKPWGEIHRERVGKKNPKKPPDKRHKEYDLAKLCDEAYARLVELELDDRERIFRFRFSGKIRIYGFLMGAEFHLLWFDPLHKIYPMGT